MKEVWYCPKCNNGDEELLTQQLAVQVSRDVKCVWARPIEEGRRICLNKTCAKCDRRYIIAVGNNDIIVTTYDNWEKMRDAEPLSQNVYTDA